MEEEKCNHEKKKWTFVTTERRHTGDIHGFFSTMPVYEDASIYRCECGELFDSQRHWGAFI